MKLSLLLVLLLIAVPTMAQAPSVTLAWDLSTSEPLGTGGGYGCYMSKQAGVYTAGSPNVTVLPGVSTIVVPNVPYGRSFFVCDAFVGDGTRSDFSNEVSTVIKPHPPTMKSAIQTALMAPVKAITKLAGLFKKDKGLRITNVS